MTNNHPLFEHIWGNKLLDFTTMFLLTPLFPLLLLPIPSVFLSRHGGWLPLAPFILVAFYGGLIAIAVLSWWGYAAIVYVACFAAGYSMMQPPKPTDQTSPPDTDKPENEK